MIKFKCPSCDKQYQLPDNAAGRKARCKACGEAMVVPEAPDELFADDAPAGDDLSSLYSDSDSAGPIDHIAAEESPMAFNPETSFQQGVSKPKAVMPPLPMKLILAGAGGAVALIVIVVVAIVMMSGKGGQDQNDANDGLAFNTGGESTTAQPANPFGSSTRPGVSAADTGTEATDPDTASPDPSEGTDTTEPEVDIEPVEVEPIEVEPVEPEPLGPAIALEDSPYYKALVDRHNKNAEDFEVLLPPSDAELVDWTLPERTVGTDNTLNESYSFNHMNLKIPAWEYWQVNTPVLGNSNRNGLVTRFASPKGQDIVGIKAFPRPEGALDWPVVALRTGGSELSQLDEANSIMWARDVPGDLVLRDNVKVEYGLLFGGYRFVRIEHEQPIKLNDAVGRKVEYIGYLGDLLHTFAIRDHPEGVEMAVLEEMIRSARLMPTAAFNTFVDNTAVSQRNFKPAVWKEWRDDPAVNVVHAESEPPVKTNASDGTGF